MLYKLGYKDFIASIKWSEEKGMYIGEIENTWDKLIFYGSTIDELKVEFREAIEGILNWR